MLSKYTQYVSWRHADGTIESIAFGTDLGLQEAINGALALAREHGWTPPRWWQFWRWGDSRPPEPDED